MIQDAPFGAIFHAKAMQMTNEAEYGHQCGSKKKTKILKGKVLSFEIKRKEGRQAQIKVLS